MSQALTQAQPIDSGAMTPGELLTLAVRNGADIAMLERLMALRNAWQADEAKKAFEAAMAAAQAEIGPIEKNRSVGFDSTKPGGSSVSYRHEDLAQIERQVKPVLAQHGLSYRFKVSSEIDQPVRVTCVISGHGHFEETTLAAGRDKSGSKNDIQSVGSTLTYLQRYALKASLGLAVAHDDDGRTSDQADEEAISEEQVKKIQKLADETSASIPKLCALLKVESVPSIKVGQQYNDALAFLEARRGKK